MLGICTKHHSPISHAFTVGMRSGVLEVLINQLKFSRSKGAAGVLASLMDESLPRLPSGVLLAHIPTVRSHVRQRGYDHVKLITDHFAALRGVTFTAVLERQTNMTQHTANRAMRKNQSKTAFRLSRGVNVQDRIVILFDDIVTTGSTLEAAATELQRAGAVVWAVTLAYQPLNGNITPRLPVSNLLK